MIEKLIRRLGIFSVVLAYPMKGILMMFLSQVLSLSSLASGSFLSVDFDHLLGRR